MKKLFLHIGPPKTGTSTIQDFLYHNRDNLRNSGYFYPQTGISKTIPAFSSAQHNLAWLITNSEMVDPTLGGWKEAHEEIEKANLDNVIISSEYFRFANKKQIGILELALKSYEVKIIVYLRRQDLRLESTYTQRVKNGRCTIDILSFAEKQKNELDYYKLLASWKQAFGINNIIVRPLEKTQIPNICYDILKVVGIANYANFSEVENKNIKPGRKAIEVLKFANKVYENKPANTRQKHVKKIANCLEKNWHEENKYRLLFYEDSARMLEQYEQSNQAVAKEYLGREDGVLFYEPLEYYENDPFTIEDLSKEELLTLILALSV